MNFNLPKKVLEKGRMAMYGLSGTFAGATLTLNQVVSNAAKNATGAEEEGAAHFNLTKSFSKKLDFAQGDLIKIASVIACVCGLVALIILLTAKDEKASRSAWMWIKRIVICYVAIISFPQIIIFLNEFKLN